MAGFMRADDSFGFQYAEEDGASTLLIEALNEMLDNSPVSNKPHYKIGRGARDRPKASTWSPPYLAERKLCGDAVRQYTVQFASGFASGVPLGIPQRPSFQNPQRSGVFSLPPATHGASGSQTARPSSQGYNSNSSRNLSPTLARFPALRSAGISPPEDSGQYALHEEQSRPSTTNASSGGNARSSDLRPFKAGAVRPRLLEQKPGLTMLVPPQQEPEAPPPGGGHWFNALGPSSSSGAPKANQRARPSRAPQQGTSMPASPSQGLDSPGAASSGATRRSSQRKKISGVPAPAKLQGTQGATDRLKSRLRLKLAGLEAAETAATDAAANSGSDDDDDELKEPPEKMDWQTFRKSHGDVLGECSGSALLDKLKHKDSKNDRIGRLTVCRKLQLQDKIDGGGGYRDRVNRSDVEIAQESFFRYFASKSGNKMNADLVIEGLADFGIKANSRTEKIQLLSVLNEFEEEVLGFNHFCNMIEEARFKLRAARSTQVFQHWKHRDKEDLGFLKQSEVMLLLEDMHVAFEKKTLERACVEAMVADITTDPATGMVSFHEVEFLVSAVREYAVQTRRRQEREIQVRFKLGKHVFSEFRSQLLRFWESFNEMDDDDSGSLDTEEVTNLLYNYGCLSNGTAQQKKNRAQEILDRFMGNRTQTLSFPQFLMVVHSLRQMQMLEKDEEVMQLFHTYDADRSGSLSIKEICQILVDLSLQPKSAMEQEIMAQLIEESDADGSNCLDAKELLHLVQRVEERLTQQTRELHNKRAEDLGFNTKRANELRQAFEALDYEGDGQLGTSEVDRVMHLMGWHLPHLKLQRIVADLDEDCSGQLDFMEFLQLMRRVEDEMRAQGSREAAGKQLSSLDGPADEGQSDDKEKEKEKPKDAGRSHKERFGNPKRLGRAAGAPGGNITLRQRR